MMKSPHESEPSDSNTTGRHSTRVLLVGWDGADNKTVLRLLESGTLPHLNSLLRRGAMLELAVPPPTCAESAWTTLATGTRPHQHGILQPMAPAKSGLHLEPVTSNDRLRPAIWNILSSAGLNTHVVGWPVTFPAEPVRGACVAEGTPFAAANADTARLARSIASPAELIPIVASRRILPTQIDEITLSQLLPRSANSLPAKPQLAAACRVILADAATRFRIFRWCLQERHWDFGACVFPGLLRLHELALWLESTSPETADTVHELIAGGYEHHDMLLGQLLQLVGLDCSVIALSLGVAGHGSHLLAGMATVSDAAIQVSSTPARRNVLDIAPTILSMFGVPCDSSMPGRTLTELFAEGLATYTPVNYDVPTQSSIDIETADEIIHSADGGSVDHLYRLGYFDPQEIAAKQSIENCVWTADLNAAISLLDAGLVDQAIRRLSQAVETRPESHPARAMLADALYRAGRRSDARQQIEWLRCHGNEQPQVYQLAAAIALADREFDEALAELEGTRRGAFRSLGADNLEGTVWLRKRRFAESSRSFRSAIDREGPTPASLTGLAAVKLQEREYDAAAEHALDALSADMSFSRAHYYLAMALVQLDKPQESLRALETWAALTPDQPAPYRWMASISESQLQDLNRARYFRTKARELTHKRRASKLAKAGGTSALSSGR